MSDQHPRRRERTTPRVRRRTVLRTAGAAVATAGVAGCLGGSSGGDGTVVVSANANLANNLDTRAFYDAGVSESIDIQLTAGPESSGSRAKAFSTALSAKQTSPDLMMMDNGWTIPFIVRKSLVNLDEALSDSFVSDVRENSFQSLVKTASHPDTGELWAIPYFPDYPTIQYRKDLLRNAGYTDAEFETWQTDPLTWSEFTAAVKRAKDAAYSEKAGTDDDPSTVSYGYLWQGASYAGLPCCSFNELLNTTGGAYFGSRENLFGPVGERPITIASQNSTDAVELGRDLIYGSDESPYDVAGVSPRATVGWTEPDVDAQFADRPNAVAIRSWTYTMGIAQSTFEGTPAELGVMPMPAGEGGSWAALGGWLMAANPNSTNLDQTLEVLKAFHSDEVQMATLNGPGFIPHEPSLFSGAATEHPVYGEFMDTLGWAGEHSVPRPVTPVWPQQSGAVATNVNAALRKSKSPTKAMTDIKETFSETEKLGR
ncbi:MAG: extracellular solute-binding protein [Haloferacaceae archaeon]